MISTKNVLKAVLISAVLNLIYTFYVSSSAFKAQLSQAGQSIGRIEAFLEVANTTTGFWPHLLKGWGTGFGLSFFACVLLLAWITNGVGLRSN